jgi:uroporphyrin-III C-methyltransferase/precorrin-2 dehydrogenase/sirohydrochlorin ferrochelatase
MTRDDQLSVFPAFFKVEDARVVVFGDGDEAYAKTRLLLNTRADITVYSEKPEPDFASYLGRHGITHIREGFSQKALRDSVLVFAATGRCGCRSRYRGCGPGSAHSRQRRRPAGLTAISTRRACQSRTGRGRDRHGGRGAPCSAQMIRAHRPDPAPTLGRLARLAASYRVAVDRLLPKGLERRIYWRRFFSGQPATAVEKGDLSAARRAATALLRQHERAGGHVWADRRRPGAEDLLTLRAQRLLQEADVIVHDRLVPAAVVAMGRRDAERISVGKAKGAHSVPQDQINDLLVDLARQGKRVVRLKAGDPLVFGRAGEEMAALQAAGIAHAVVPGITAAVAAAASIKLPLTLRGVASSLVFATGHDRDGETLPGWAGLALSGATVAVYMGKTVAAAVAARLVEAGLPPATPVAAIENASRTDERVLAGTVADLAALADRDDVAGPVLIVVGDVVAHADLSTAERLTAAPVSARFAAFAAA